VRKGQTHNLLPKLVRGHRAREFTRLVKLLCSNAQHRHGSRWRSNPIIELLRPSTFAMPHFRRPKQPAGTTTPIPTPPEELVQDLTFQRDSRALAATSATIALSIGSAFKDTRGTFNDGTTVRGTDAMRQTAYFAVRMAVEVIKESSDMFLPLKAVAGAISALMKNYDVSVSCSRVGCFLIPRLFAVPANDG